MRASLHRPTIITEYSWDERRRFARPKDWVDKYQTRMVGYWLTRQRLASSQGLFGRWQRLTLLYRKYDWVWVRALQHYLPPECVAPGHQKIRSPRSGVSLDEILLALGDLPLKEEERWARMLAVLNEPDYIIKGMATMYGLRRVVA